MWRISYLYASGQLSGSKYGICANNRIIYYYFNNLFHNREGPAIRYFNSQYESYYINGTQHRVDYPAYITYVDGYPDECIFYYNGLQHRSNGPAYICYNGPDLHDLLWYINGEIHRSDGPAVILYNTNMRQLDNRELYHPHGDNSLCEYYIDGKRVTYLTIYDEQIL